jgi:hypothetical protein
MTNEKCCYCGSSFALTDVRPYGPDSRFTCLPCAKSTPERKEIAESAFAALSSGPTMLTPTGPVALAGNVNEEIAFGAVLNSFPPDIRAMFLSHADPAGLMTFPADMFTNDERNSIVARALAAKPNDRPPGFYNGGRAENFDATNKEPPEMVDIASPEPPDLVTPNPEDDWEPPEPIEPVEGAGPTGQLPSVASLEPSDPIIVEGRIRRGLALPDIFDNPDGFANQDFTEGEIDAYFEDDETAETGGGPAPITATQPLPKTSKKSSRKKNKRS